MLTPICACFQALLVELDDVVPFGGHVALELHSPDANSSSQLSMDEWYVKLRYQGDERALSALCGTATCTLKQFNDFVDTCNSVADPTSSQYVNLCRNPHTSDVSDTVSASWRVAAAVLAASTLLTMLLLVIVWYKYNGLKKERQQSSTSYLQVSYSALGEDA